MITCKTSGEGARAAGRGEGERRPEAPVISSAVGTRRGGRVIYSTVGGAFAAGRGEGERRGAAVADTSGTSITSAEGGRRTISSRVGVAMTSAGSS